MPSDTGVSVGLDEHEFWDKGYIGFLIARFEYAPIARRFLNIGQCS